MNFARKWRMFDYLTCVVLLFVGWVNDSYVKPYCRSFDFADSRIKYPRVVPETFPTYSVIIAVMLVVLFYIVGEYLIWRRQGRYAVLRSINKWVLVQFFSISLSFCITCLCKVYAGRLRPDFLQRLADEGITEKTIESFSTEQVCAAARQGRLSFPSGHSSTAFAGFVPLTFYLLGVTKVFWSGLLYMAFLCLLPLAFPIFVAISRTRDNYHNFDDILAGAAIGTFTGILSVFIFFTIGLKGQWLQRCDACVSLSPVSTENYINRNTNRPCVEASHNCDLAEQI